MAARHCCVPNCNSDDRTKGDEIISFHTFPTDKILKKSWIIAIRRDEGPLFKIHPRSTVVCSKHFHPGEIRKTLAGRRFVKQGVVPSIFEWNGTPKQERSAVAKRRRLEQERQATLHQTEVQPEHSAECEEDKENRPCPTDHDYIVVDVTSTEDKLAAALQRIADQDEEIRKLRMEKFGLARFTDNPDLIRFYTGFKDYTLLQAVYVALEPTATSMLRWSQVQRQRGNKCEAVRRDAFKSESLPLIDQFFMFLCTMRQGFREQDLAVRFGISQATVSRTLITWANYLYCVLGSTSIWPTKDQVQENMPESFRKLYPATRVILDCTELKTQTPSSLFTNSQMYSNYKGTTTLKGLVGITPAGGISFISSLYTGSISDKEITKRSGVYGLLEPGDGVMVDKGFTIEEELKDVGAHLIIPPFLTNKRKCFRKAEVEKTQQIARLRIHVERAIRRVREFHIFDGVVPISLMGTINQIWTVCCILTNSKDPLY